MKGLLKKILEEDLMSITKTIPNFVGQSGDMDSEDIENQVTSHLVAKQEEDDMVETVTFGLETDDGDIVKVYVNKEHADEFEQKLSEMLGQEDNIEDLLEILSKDYDIVDVAWPGEDDENTEDDEFAPEEDEEVETSGAADEEKLIDDTLPNGKESMNDKTNEKKTYGSRLRDRLMKGMNEGQEAQLHEVEAVAPQGSGNNIDDAEMEIDPNANDILQRYKAPYVQLGFKALMKFGISANMIKVIVSRNPTFVRELNERVKDMGAANRNRLMMAMSIEDDK